MSSAELSRWLAASRTRSGVPVKVEDEGVLLEVAYRLLALLAGMPAGKGGGDARPT